MADITKYADIWYIGEHNRQIAYLFVPYAKLDTCKVPYLVQNVILTKISYVSTSQHFFGLMAPPLVTTKTVLDFQTE